MASPVKTWRRPQWSQGGFVPQLPQLRATYGVPIAEVVELFALIARDHRDGPTAQDEKHTLRSIIETPAAADLSGLDAGTEARLALAQWRRYRRQGPLELLSVDERQACAQDALAAFKAKAGRPGTDALAADLVRALYAVTQELPQPRRRPLLCAALQACGIGRRYECEADRDAELEKTCQRVIRASGTPLEHWRLPKPGRAGF